MAYNEGLQSDVRKQLGFVLNDISENLPGAFMIYRADKEDDEIFYANTEFLDMDGYEIGGLAVGETHEEMYRVIDAVVPHLPEDKPIYLMGVVTPENILEAVERGVDFFDCVLPARNGRHGHLFTANGKINIMNKKFETDERPIDEGCQCPACKHYTRSYIRHLFKAKEMLAMRLAVLHNLYFYNNMMQEIRDNLDNGTFAEYKAAKLEAWGCKKDK